MYIPHFTYFNVVMQCCQRHALSLGARALFALWAGRITSKLGERKARHSHLCVSACCVVFNQEHWKRWIETQQENKKSPDALTSMSFPHITGGAFVLQPLKFLYCDEKDVDSDAASFIPPFILTVTWKQTKGGGGVTANRHPLSLVNF